jgi:hypothetical protein
MYGLPQAGKLANNRLLLQLAKCGYHPTRHTDGLWRHVTRPITFCLTVDNFGVKTMGNQHTQHLLNSLSHLYTVTTDWLGSLYCGLTLK